MKKLLFFMISAACCCAASAQLLSGKCGSSVNFQLQNGVLTISGSGEMDSWMNNSNCAPWYDDRASIKSVIIHEGVQSIGSYAFNYCTNMTDIQIANSVKYIDICAFQGCSSLSEIIIPDGTAEIGRFAFMNCTKLRVVKLGCGLDQLYSHVFMNCRMIYAIESKAVVPPLTDSTTFKGVSASALISVPRESMDYYKGANDWNRFANIKGVGHSVDVSSADDMMGSASILKEAAAGDVRCVVVAEPKEGYRFVRWSDGITANPHITEVEGDTAVQAIFEPFSRSLIATSENDAMGRVKVSISAEPESGYRFTRWSDGDVNPERSMYVNEDIELYAEFEPDHKTIIQNAEGEDISVRVIDDKLMVDNQGESYAVFDAAGRKAYDGAEASISLPKGIYIVLMHGHAVKVVL